MQTKILRMGAATMVLSFFVVVFSLAYSGHGDVLFSLIKWIPGGDKTGHVILVGGLAFFLSWFTHGRGFRLFTVSIPYGVAAVFLFMTAEEFCQRCSPYRTFDLGDLGCNYIGIGLAWLLLFVLARCAKRGARACQAIDGSESKENF